MRGVMRSSRTAMCATLLFAACTGGDEADPAPTTSPPEPIVEASDCESVASHTVDALQRHVDRFDGVSADAVGRVAEQSAETLDEVAGEMRSTAQDLGCDPVEMRRLLTNAVVSLDGDTPIGRMVAATFRSALAGGDDPSDPGPGDYLVSTSSQLLSTLEIAGSGSTIRLAPGDYAVDQTLVLFRDVAITGGGRETTTLSSTASGAAVLTLATGTVRFENLSIRHVGDRPASVVVVRGGRVDLRGIALSGGRRGDDEAQGGFGVLFRGTPGDADSLLDDVSIRENAGGGILVAGSEAPRLASVAIEANGPCGVCYLENAAGTLVDATIRGHDVGLQITGSAAPTVEGITLTDNDVGMVFGGDGSSEVGEVDVGGGLIGVQIEDPASTRIRGLTVTGVEEAAVIVLAGAEPDLDEVVCDGTDTGVVVVFEGSAATIGDDVDCVVATAVDG